MRSMRSQSEDNITRSGRIRQAIHRAAAMRS